MMKRIYSVVLLSASAMTCSVGCLSLPTLARAQSTFDVTVLAGACANCHGTDGRSPGGIPSLAGRPADVLKMQMLAYKSDTPPAGTTIMNRLAKGYSDAEIDALAQHFSKISPVTKATQPEVR